MLGVELRTTGKFFLDLDNCFCFHEVDGIACLPDWMRPSRLGITVDRIGRLSRDDRTTENSSDTRRSRRPYTSIRSTNDNRCEREKQPSTNVPSKRKLRLCPCFFFSGLIIVLCLWYRSVRLCRSFDRRKTYDAEARRKRPMRRQKWKRDSGRC